MAPYRFPGPVCQIKDWYDGIDDGTLARVRSPNTSVLNGADSNLADGPDTPSGSCSFLEPAGRFTVLAPSAAFDRLRTSSGAAAISATTPRAAYTWPNGSSSAALEQQITIDGQSISVIRPENAQAAGKNLPTTAQLAEALRAVPRSQRIHTRRVVISPLPATGSTPGHTIAGEGGGGEIDLYPVNQPQTQQDFDNRVTHESGHNYQGNFWHSAGDVAAWQTVAVQDHKSPSRYADENPGEDFSEFIILYNTTRGTACEAAASAMYPHRWARLQGYSAP